jgi:F-type H+-transporting ATPase subunit gamma
MATLKDIRKRITSVKNTQQITKAMKMVAAAKLKRAQDAATDARPYGGGLERILAEVVSRSVDAEAPPPHPLLEMRSPVRHVELVVMTSDRGLCGGFNSNILRRASRFLYDNAGTYETITVSTIGRKGRDYFRRRTTVKQGSHHAGVFEDLRYEQAEKISEDLRTRYLSPEHELDAVYLLYNKFISVITQEVTLDRLLPVEPPAHEGAEGKGGLEAVDFKYEPDRDTVLDTLLPKYLTSKIWRSLLESLASEHAARMTAMDSATRNAGDMIDSLTLLANRTRQAAITTELVEIVSGAEAL